MRRFSFLLLHFFWRKIALPVMRLLPLRRQMQFRTLAHHVKMTFVHGQIIDFYSQVFVNTTQSCIPPEMVLFPAVTPVEPSFILNKSVPLPLIPVWIVDELRSLSEIEPDLCPTPEFLASFVSYTPPLELGPGEVYRECSSIISDFNADIIFLIPWLVVGGADQGVLHHVTAALAAGKNVLVISTIDRESSWRKRLPQEAKFIELGELGRGLSESQRLSVLTRIVLQSSAKIIHIINSPLGWDMLKQYGRSLNAVNKHVFASVFCDDYDYHGCLRSYAQMYFVDCWKYLDGIMCDTQWYPQDLKRQYGVSLDKIKTIYFPVSIESTFVYRAVSEQKILWVGRFAQQKRVDLLIKIARLLPHINFDVYGYAVHPYEREMEDEMRKLGNINLHGAFESLESVVATNSYSLLLYTSGWDGLPLTLLDATMAGLPIVASAVGGVPEFINEETGYPVWNHDSPLAYVERINQAMMDDVAKRLKWDSAVELLLARHTTAHFTLQLNKICGYFDDK